MPLLSVSSCVNVGKPRLGGVFCGIGKSRRHVFTAINPNDLFTHVEIVECHADCLTTVFALTDVGHAVELVSETQ